MNEEDINRLLEGRKVVDVYISVAKEYYEASIISNETKSEADISFTKEKYEAREVAIRKMHKNMFNLGFGSGEDTTAIEEFNDFNGRMNYEALTTCRPVQGYCDGCKGNLDEFGKETGMMCAKIYSTGKTLCEDDVKDRPELIKQLSILLTFKVIAFFGDSGYKRKGNITRGACPEGHGFYVDETLCKPFPFSLWRDIITPLGLRYRVPDEVLIQIRNRLDAKGQFIVNEMKGSGK